MFVAIGVLCLTLAQLSNANCPNPRLEKYDEEPADKQCFYEPTVEQNCSTRTVQDEYPKYRKTCEEIWVKKTFEIEIEECSIIDKPEECVTEILQECTTVTKKGKCVDVSVPRGECRTETFCDGACPLPRTATGPIDGEPPLDGAPRQARVNPLLDFARQGRQFNGNSQCCQTLSLNLRNQPNARQGLFNQLYTVQPNQINGREYWSTADRSLAIWFTRRNVWCIGQSVNLGSETCSFHSSLDVTCPQFVGSQWKYWDGARFLNANNDAQVNCQRSLFRTTRQAFRQRQLGRQGRQQEYDATAAVAPSSSYGVDTTDDRLAEGQGECLEIEICDYDIVNECCDFPEQECVDVPSTVCTAGKEQLCEMVPHETCVFLTEEKCSVEEYFEPCYDTKEICDDIEVPQWWCKECDGADGDVIEA